MANSKRRRLFCGSCDLGVFAEPSVALIGSKLGAPYSFTVQAMDAAVGNESSDSNTVTVTSPAP